MCVCILAMNLLLHRMLAVYALPFLLDCGSQSAAASCTSGIRYINPLCCIPYASHSQRVAAVLLISHAAPGCGQGCRRVMAVFGSRLQQLLLQWLLPIACCTATHALSAGGRIALRAAACVGAKPVDVHQALIMISCW
jgi:hypothetical protein